MNQAPKNDTEIIRSEIDTTRRRMDDTMEALGERLKGRHLFDELLGLFRSDNQNPKAMEIQEKVTRSATTAARSVVDTVKSNPMPALLIGAGIAWMIYSSRKSSNSEKDPAASFENRDPDLPYDRPLDYPSPASLRGSGEEVDSLTRPEEAESKLEQFKVGIQQKATAAAGQVKEVLANAGNQVQETARVAGQRARDAGSRVQARTREVYVKARDQVVSTANEHPLEVGLACVAAGVALGLALPTPEKLNRLAGPTVDRFKQRTRDAGGEIVQKGKRVLDAASAALKNEAQQQGLTFDALRQKAGAVADKAKGAVKDAAQNEGVLSAAAPSGSDVDFSSIPENNSGRNV